MSAALHDCCGQPDAHLISFDQARQAALDLARPLSFQAEIREVVP